MPDDLSFLDQLEEWLEAQVPRNIHDLPYRMLDTMERVSNEIFETLNIQGSPSISIPFPPFGGKDVPAPPPPPPAFTALPMTLYHKAAKVTKAHPYIVGHGVGLAVTVGLGCTGFYASALLGYGGARGKRIRDARKFGTRGVIQDGMLKEAIVILSPSPMPPLLWVLTVTSLKAGYVVLVAVPHVEDAEQLEKRLAPLEERSGLRVLIYDPDDSSTFHPFQRSLSATLTLRFPAQTNVASRDPYNPSPDHVPHVHAFISLYALHPCPPTTPSGLPAIPSLLATHGHPMLLTLYPSTSVLVQPDSFASQLLTATHRLLGQNTAAYSPSRVVSLYVGDIALPPLHQLVNNVRLMIHRLSFKESWTHASTLGKVFVVKDAVVKGIKGLWPSLTGYLGIGPAARDYKHFEKRILQILKSNRRSTYYIGQYSYFPRILARSPVAFSLLRPILPALPDAVGPLHASVQGLPALRKPLSSKSSTAASSIAEKKPASRGTDSAASSDHESAEDMTSSIFSLHSVQSAHTTSSREAESTGSGNGLEDSWAQLDAPQ